MPAPGFHRIDGSALPAAYTGRIWRVNFTEECEKIATSQGNHGVQSITVTESSVIVRRRDGGRSYPLSLVESVLVEDEPPKQRTLAGGWS